jgi:hypothetical protein
MSFACPLARISADEHPAGGHRGPRSRHASFGPFRRVVWMGVDWAFPIQGFWRPIWSRLCGWIPSGADTEVRAPATPLSDPFGATRGSGRIGIFDPDATRVLAGNRRTEMRRTPRTGSHVVRTGLDSTSVRNLTFRSDKTQNRLGLSGCPHTTIGALVCPRDEPGVSSASRQPSPRSRTWLNPSGYGQDLNGPRIDQHDKSTNRQSLSDTSFCAETSRTLIARGWQQC